MRSRRSRKLSHTQTSVPQGKLNYYLQDLENYSNNQESFVQSKRYQVIIVKVVSTNILKE